MNIAVMSVHIGNIIQKSVKKKGIKVTVFADQINCSRRNVYEIFKKKNIDTELLQVISEKLEENLFMHYLSESDLTNYQHTKYANLLIEKLTENEQMVASPDLVYNTTDSASTTLLGLIEELKKEVDRLKALTSGK